MSETVSPEDCELSALRSRLREAAWLDHDALRVLPTEQIGLLVEYYVRGCPAVDLARDLGCSAASIGGRLTQARRALRRALRPPLSHEAVEEYDRRDVAREEIAERRAKVARFLQKRMDEPAGAGARGR
jgi:hypothetical protein